MDTSGGGNGQDQERAGRACARETIALLPFLRRFVASRVQAAGADLGLSVRQFAALRGIQEGASSPGELARLWQVTPAVITGIVDRLEGRGLVRREPDPVDRRRLRLVLTESGRQASDTIENALLGALVERFGRVSAAELTDLERALVLLQRTLAAVDEDAPIPEPSRAGDDTPLWDDDAGDGWCDEPAITPRRRAAAAPA